MACYYPLLAYRAKFVNATGKRSLVFNPRDSVDPDDSLRVPCGQCIGCRLERSRQWAIRCMHESQLHDKNCFITLTYDDDHVPINNSLDVRDFQLFMKRLRKEFGRGIRFFHCGEYGERLQRPHYHACIFGFDFDDKELWSVRDDVRLYRSACLERLWPWGFTTVGEVTFESAAYVARYCTKKVTGRAAIEHYMCVSSETGEIVGERKPEYVTMSRRPGIGRAWFDKFRSDIFPSDECLVRGVLCRPPKYYDSLESVVNPFQFEDVQFRRILARSKFAFDNTSERLRVKEVCKKAAIKSLRRSYESDDSAA